VPTKSAPYIVTGTTHREAYFYGCGEPEGPADTPEDPARAGNAHDNARSSPHRQPLIRGAGHGRRTALCSRFLGELGARCQWREEEDVKRECCATVRL